MTRRHWRVRGGLIAIGVVLSVGSLALAEEPPADEEQPANTQPAETQQPAAEEPALKSQSPTSQGNSLAQAAARIQLKQPTSDGPLVISNANLQKSGATGAMSMGGGVSAASSGQTTGAASAPGSTNPANTLVQQYNEQLRIVESLEVRLKNFDTQLKEPARDPHYPYVTSRPHDRAPGVQDPASAQRDALTKQLEAERKKLGTLRDRARRQGVQLD